MLVLSRKREQRIALRQGDRIIGYLMPIEIRGDKVRLGLQFDGDITILREEILLAQERSGAAKSALDLQRVA